MLAALELNLLQQNKKYSQVSGNFAAAKLVELAAILPERKTVKLAAISLAANSFVADCFGFNLGDSA